MSLYLVTGGCGFIGSHLCDYLIEKGHKVRVLDNLSTGKIENIPPSVEFIKGDILDKNILSQVMQNVDGCFHLAAIVSIIQSVENWTETHEVNLTGCINVLNAAKGNENQNPIPVVYTSSSAIYGDNPELPLSEMSVGSPISAYGADKLGCEFHAKVASITFNVPTRGLRLFNVYGSRQSPSSAYSGVISIFADRIKNGKSITVFGDGTQTRDFIYVKDIVRFFAIAMQHNKSGYDIINACTGIPTSINELNKILSDIYDCSTRVEYAPFRTGEIKYSLGSPHKALEEYGLKTQYTLKQGLQDMLESVKA